MNVKKTKENEKEISLIDPEMERIYYENRYDWL